MVATKGQAIALAVISILTLGAGIAVMVLFHSTFDAISSSYRGGYPVVALFWPYGLPVLVTGVMGLIAAGVRNNVAVGLFMAAGIICLIIEAAFAVMAAIALLFLSCGLNLQCESNGVVHLARASCALIIVSWLLMLVGTIMSCVACCCGKPDLGQPGAIIIGSPGYEMQNPGGGYPQGYPQHSQPGQQYAPYPQDTKGQHY